jgi:RNA polymerase sigma factor (sigma-70 family)
MAQVGLQATAVIGVILAHCGKPQMAAGAVAKGGLMDSHTVCVQIATELNEAEGWHLPTEALSDLAQAVLPFVDPTLPGQKAREVIRNYYHDSHQVAVMAAWDDPEAEALWEVVRRRFISQAYREGVPDTDAEDVAQEAWRKARTKLSTFQFRSRLQAWLNAVIRNECRQWLRLHKRKLPELPLDALDLGEESREVQEEVADSYQRDAAAGASELLLAAPENQVLYEERVTVLMKAVDRLIAGKYMQILWYSFIETERIMPDGRVVKWTDAKIAEEIGLSPGSIAQTRDRILNRLRDDLDFQRVVASFFGADWLDKRTPIRKGRVRKPPVRNIPSVRQTNEGKQGSTDEL